MAHDLDEELNQTPLWLIRELIGRLNKDRREFPETGSENIHTKKTYSYTGRRFRYLVYVDASYLSAPDMISGFSEPGVLVREIRITRKARIRIFGGGRSRGVQRRRKRSSARRRTRRPDTGPIGKIRWGPPPYYRDETYGEEDTSRIPRYVLSRISGRMDRDESSWIRHRGYYYFHDEYGIIYRLSPNEVHRTKHTSRGSNKTRYRRSRK